MKYAICQHCGLIMMIADPDKNAICMNGPIKDRIVKRDGKNPYVRVLTCPKCQNDSDYH